MGMPISCGTVSTSKDNVYYEFLQFSKNSTVLIAFSDSSSF